MFATLVDLGFRLENTGGNLQANRLDVAADCYLLVSTSEGEAVGDPDAPIWGWCVYHCDRPEDASSFDLTLEAAAMWAYARAAVLRAKRTA